MIKNKNGKEDSRKSHNQRGGPPRGLGEQGRKVIYFRGTREQKSKTEGNRGTKAVLGNREHRKSRFWFWKKRKNAVEPWEQVPPPPPPHTHTHTHIHTTGRASQSIDRVNKLRRTARDKPTKSKITRPRGYKTLFMLNSDEHEIFSANELKMPMIVGIFIFISREIFVLRYV